jgi:DNA-nicking Smr family endonuclease
VHGASRAAAVHEVSKHVAALDAIAGSGGAVLRVITGKGKHSKDGVSVVRAEVRAPHGAQDAGRSR